MSKHRARPVVLVASFLTIALAAAGCGSSSSSKAAAPSSSASSAATGTATDLKGVSLTVGQTGYSIIGLALKTAHLDNTPYKLSFPVFTGGNTQLEALTGGALDVASSSDIPPVFAAAVGAPSWKVVAVQRSSTLLQEVLVKKGSKISSIAQLKGKKVGFVQNTTAQYFLNALLVQNGLTFKDITAAPLLPAAGVAALTSGAVDALATYGNAVITLHQQGATTIGSGKDILSGNFPWEASAKVLNDPKTAAALVDLWSRVNKAFAYIRNGHEQEYAAATAAATQQPVAQALSTITEEEAQTPTTMVPVSPAAITAEQSVADAFTSLGALPKKVDVASYWSTALSAQLQAVS